MAEAEELLYNIVMAKEEHAVVHNLLILANIMKINISKLRPHAPVTMLETRD